MEKLSQLGVMVIDCQATAAAPSGHLLEVAWARSDPAGTQVRSRLVALPAGQRIPPAVARITGLSEPMMRDGADPHLAWCELMDDAARSGLQPAPAVIHFARFEKPFLERLADGQLQLDIVCTHEIARRLFPDLPRRSLRALAGYLGHGVSTLRRSTEHVEATVVLWRDLVRRLEEQGIRTWPELKAWLATPVASRRISRRVWPMPRETRLSLPRSPGVYRMLRVNGDVLYVGKAASLHDRVNSHFRKQHGANERALEMLSQARAISFDVAVTPLEAALLETDEIKRHRPPYNVALATEGRAVWFATADLCERSPQPSSQHPLGPIVSAETLDQFAALARGDRAALGSGRWSPDETTFDAGYERLCATHPELSRIDQAPSSRLLRLGTRLWREGRRDHDVEDEAAADSDRGVRRWSPELVQVSLEWLALRAALVRRRAMWLTRLVDASVVWREPGSVRSRSIVIERGEIVLITDADDTPAPIPPGHQRTVIERRELFTIATFDRLRVLTTELKRLVAAEASVSVRFGRGPALRDAKLARALWWV